MRVGEGETEAEDETDNRDDVHALPHPHTLTLKQILRCY